jgi:SAM-dependent methyltransferase
MARIDPVLPKGKGLSASKGPTKGHTRNVIRPGRSPFDDGGRLEAESVFHDQEFADRGRTTTDKFYAITRTSWSYCTELLRTRGAACRVLELGCGPGSFSFALATLGAQVVGIDISERAIKESRALARKKHLEKQMTFQRMNAEALDLPAGSFDLVFGMGILHHLDLAKAFPQIARVLRPRGSALFLEPMGHNPLINLYRRRTPALRTSDEHPLLVKDLKFARSFFRHADGKFFHLSALLATPFRGHRSFQRLLELFEGVDESLFRWIPASRKLAWIVVLDLAEPLHGSPAALSSTPSIRPPDHQVAV